MFSPLYQCVAAATNAAKRAIVQRLVNSYLDGTEASIAAFVLPALNFYRRAATTVIDKTAEKPEVAIELFAAVERAVQHYGPALKADLAKLESDIESLNCGAVEAHFKCVKQALRELTE